MAFKQFTEEQQREVLKLFASRCENLNIKSGTKTFFKEQAAFIAGVVSASSILKVDTPPYWSIACISDRPLINSKTSKDGI
jgi:hypothetical protein